MSNACGALTVFSFGNVVATIDDREIKGLWEGDDVISVERTAQLGTPLVGADGSAVMSVTMDQTATVTLRLMPNSAMNQYLRSVAKRQRAGFNRILRIAIQDTSTGEGGGCSSAMVMQEPNWSLGAAATSRDWVIFCSCWQDNDVNYRPVA